MRRALVVAAGLAVCASEARADPERHARASATATPTPLATTAAAPRFAGPPRPPAGGWRSVATGAHNRGTLRRGVELPEAGRGFLTWDPVLETIPSRPWRRWGTDRLVATLLNVAAQFSAAHPEAGPLLIADLSRPRGGPFGAEFGGLGHLSHRNGLDADIPYPRRDRLPIAPRRASEVDRRLAQELVDRFRAAGASKLFVGPNLGLKGPRGVVIPLVHHDDHLHVRLPLMRQARR